MVESDRELGEIGQMLQHWNYRLMTEGPACSPTGITAGEPGQRVDASWRADWCQRSPLKRELLLDGRDLPASKRGKSESFVGQDRADQTSL